jgi:hypothetical protein
MAARDRLFDSGAGASLWFGAMIAAAFGLWGVWRQYKAYRI